MHSQNFLESKMVSLKLKSVNVEIPGGSEQKEEGTINFILL